MSNRFKLVIVALVLLVGILVIFNDIRNTYIKLGAIKNELCQLKAELQNYHSLVLKVSDIDNKFTQELANAQAENNRLYSHIINGLGRLQLNIEQETTATGLDDAKTCELTGEARQNYYLLRDDIITKDNMILGLQEYISQVCLVD